MGRSLPVQGALSGRSLGAHWPSMGQSLCVPWALTGHPWAAPWALLGRSLAAVGALLGCPWGGPWAFLGCSLAVHGLLLGHSLAVMGLSVGRSLGSIPRALAWCPLGAPCPCSSSIAFVPPMCALVCLFIPTSGDVGVSNQGYAICCT